MRNGDMTNLVIFRDESGNVGEYRYVDDETGDKWVEIGERARKRLGLVDSDEENRRWPQVRAAAMARAPKGKR